jgi:hypothetical protein
MATALGIISPSACGPITITSAKYDCSDYYTRQVLTTAGYVRSMKVASSSLRSIPTSSRGDGVGSRASVERSPPSVGALVSTSSHDKLVDFLHREVLDKQDAHHG